MPDANDIALLREYAGRNSEPAFAALVHRHINLVYSVALRFTGNCEDAQDATQAVFIILAQKAASLNQRTILTGWLYETTRFTAMRLLRTKARQQAREQEAYMQSTLNNPDADGVWKQLAPLLEEAMARLNEKERTLLALRFFENKTSAETAAILGIREWAARKRVGRAMEKLQRHFSRRGVNSTTAIIAGAISANSVQAAPVGLAKTISAVAITKGAAASTSILTLIKGALKIMAWTKMKTAIVIGVVILLTAATATITVKEIREHRTYPWQLPHFNSTNFMDTLSIVHSILEQTAPQVRIVPTIHPQGIMEWPSSEGGVSYQLLDGKIITHTNPLKFLDLGMTVHDMIDVAYGAPDDRHTLFSTPLPQGRYDFIANLPQGAPEALQSEIEKKFGLVGTWQMIETNVLLLKLANPVVQGFKPACSLMREMNLTTNSLGGPMAIELGDAQKEVSKRSGDTFYRTEYRFNNPLANLIKWNDLEGLFNMPIIDETDLTNRYDFAITFVFNIPKRGAFGNPDKEMWNSVLAEQLGLELVPAIRPVKMLVVEKAN